MCLRFVRGNLHFGQMTILILYLSLDAMRLVAAKRWLVGGLLLAVAINFKTLPIVLVSYLVYRREFSTAIVAATGVVLLFFVPGLWLGMDQTFSSCRMVANCKSCNTAKHYGC